MSSNSSGFTDQQDRKSVVTVGTRATLPSIYMENETPNNLRYRTRLPSDDLNNNNIVIFDESKKTQLVNPWNDSHLEGSGLDNTYRTVPSYGTPGTTSSVSGYGDEWPSTDSGILGIRSHQFRKPWQGVSSNVENPNGSFISSNDCLNVVSSSPLPKDIPQDPTPSVLHDDKVRATLDDLHRRWRHHQRRVELYGTKQVLNEAMGSIKDLNTIRDMLPVLVTTIIVASCFVTIGMITSGLARDPSATQLSDNINGKYKSIAFGRSRLAENLGRLGRLPPNVLKDEDGVILGGKRASIQFAFNLKTDDVKAKSTDDSLPVPLKVETDLKKTVADAANDKEPNGVQSTLETDSAMIEKLTLKVASKVVSMVNDINKAEIDAKSVGQLEDQPVKTEKKVEVDNEEDGFVEDDDDDDDEEIDDTEEDDDCHNKIVKSLDKKESKVVPVTKAKREVKSLTVKVDSKAEAASETKKSRVPLKKITEDKPDKPQAKRNPTGPTTPETVVSKKKVLSKKTPRVDPFSQYLPPEKTFIATSGAKVVPLKPSTTARPTTSKKSKRTANSDEDDPFRGPVQ